jgi:hypothetical protein
LALSRLEAAVVDSVSPSVEESVTSPTLTWDTPKLTVLRRHLDSDQDRDRVSLETPEVMEEVPPPETEEVLSSPSLEQVDLISLPPLCSTVPEVVWLLEVLVVTLASTPTHPSSLATSPLVLEKIIDSMLHGSLALDSKCAQ